MGRRIQIEDFDLAGNYKHQFSDKFGVTFSGTFLDQKYRDLSAPDLGEFTGLQSSTKIFSITPSYRYSQKLSGNLLYEYSDLSYKNQVSGEQTGHTVALGASGQLLAKVSGSIYLGFQRSKFKNPFFIGAESKTDPFYSLNLSWAARAKTLVTLSGRSNFQSSANGQVNDRKNLQLGIRERLTDRSTLIGGIIFSKNEYSGVLNRQDDSLLYRAGFSYTLTDTTSLNTNIDYEDRTSTFDRFTYSQMSITAGVSRIW